MNRNAANEAVFWQRVLLAGAAGGIAEVLWVWSYGVLARAPVAGIPSDIAAAATAGASHSAAFGYSVHFALSFAIAMAFAVTLLRPLQRRAGSAGVVLGAVACLGVIWAANFLVLLPAVAPQFVHLLPLTVTFASKALFGVALGGVLCRRDVRRSAAHAAQLPVAAGLRVRAR